MNQQQIEKELQILKNYQNQYQFSYQILKKCGFFYEIKNYATEIILNSNQFFTIIIKIQKILYSQEDEMLLLCSIGFSQHLILILIQRSISQIENLFTQCQDKLLLFSNLQIKFIKSEDSNYTNLISFCISQNENKKSELLQISFDCYKQLFKPLEQLKNSIIVNQGKSSESKFVKQTLKENLINCLTYNFENQEIHQISIKIKNFISRIIFFQFDEFHNFLAYADMMYFLDEEESVISCGTLKHNFMLPVDDQRTFFKQKKDFANRNVIKIKIQYDKSQKEKQELEQIFSEFNYLYFKNVNKVITDKFQIIFQCNFSEQNWNATSLPELFINKMDNQLKQQIEEFFEESQEEHLQFEQKISEIYCKFKLVRINFTLQIQIIGIKYLTFYLRCSKHCNQSKNIKNKIIQQLQQFYLNNFQIYQPDRVNQNFICSQCKSEVKLIGCGSCQIQANNTIYYIILPNNLEIISKIFDIDDIMLQQLNIFCQKYELLTISSKEPYQLISQLQQQNQQQIINICNQILYNNNIKEIIGVPYYLNKQFFQDKFIQHIDDKYINGIVQETNFIPCFKVKEVRLINFEEQIYSELKQINQISE